MNAEERDELVADNARERRAFVISWAASVRTHDDAEWSRQGNVLIDSQLQSARETELSPEEYAARERSTRGSRSGEE
ncbi:hypothetical protein GCM10027435_00950 [Haloparvum alkalitolerans]|uniref:hypothetical protein n=1 Tax=Haloparvum TaxID=1820337 RepID=UPI00071E7026|nr:hypothetical protein [Haloparvum sedimenti]